MNRKKKGAFLCAAAGVLALAVLLSGIWYAWPLPFAVFSVNETNAEGIDCLVMEAGVREGTPIIDTYRLQKQLLFPIVQKPASKGCSFSRFREWEREFCNRQHYLAV